jgi:hypothetical protein
MDDRAECVDMPALFRGLKSKIDSPLHPKTEPCTLCDGYLEIVGHKISYSIQDLCRRIQGYNTVILEEDTDRFDSVSVIDSMRFNNAADC